MERRRHARIFLKAYGLNQSCRVHMDGADRIAQIIDISPGGSRMLLADGGPMPAQGVRGTLVRGENFQLAYLRDVAYTVAWVKSDQPGGFEFGASFDVDLDASVSGLQADLADLAG
ncbi:PilZ domain-containing protein [Nitratidesulfovibrio termitidis]|uniref:PilZ domain-containing protein n=1 Tax=Nitratidesulfovibrio termitidis TaxID=42252 RepID=UPI00041F7C89|nr:PilZ domain-containing protein [Nitratidesulfovibrio termitidis]